MAWARFGSYSYADMSACVRIPLRQDGLLATMYDAANTPRVQ